MGVLGTIGETPQEMGGGGKRSRGGKGTVKKELTGQQQLIKTMRIKMDLTRWDLKKNDGAGGRGPVKNKTSG